MVLILNFHKIEKIPTIFTFTLDKNLVEASTILVVLNKLIFIIFLHSSKFS